MLNKGKKEVSEGDITNIENKLSDINYTKIGVSDEDKKTFEERLRENRKEL
jgi:hypothetical protein